MVRRTTVFAVILFVVLLAFTLIWQKYKKNITGNQTPTATSTSHALFSFTETDITSFSIEDTQGHSVSFSKDAKNSWVLAGQTATTTMTTTVESAVTSLVSLTSSTKMDPSVAPVQIGLLKPSKTIIVQTAVGSKFTLEIGDANAIGNGYYARLNGDTPVVVDKYGLDTVLALLTSPPIAPTKTPVPTPTISTSATATPGATVEPTITPTP